MPTRPVWVTVLLAVASFAGDAGAAAGGGVDPPVVSAATAELLGAGMLAGTSVVGASDGTGAATGRGTAAADGTGAGAGAAEVEDAEDAGVALGAAATAFSRRMAVSGPSPVAAVAVSGPAVSG